MSKKAKENKIINFLSCLVIPGFFLSSNINTINITNNQTKIELPFKEKKAKKELKKILWGNNWFKKFVKK